jgi:ATP-dependent helicase HrpB
MRCLLAGFPDRLARRRDVGSDKGLMVGQRGVKLSPRSLVTSAELFLCIDVDGAAADALVHQASAVERSWLPPDQLRTADELFFHPSQRQVAARRRVYWDDLLLEESPAQVPKSDEAAELLFQAAAAQWDRVFPNGDDAVATFVDRVRCLSAWMPEMGLPTFDTDQLHAVLRQLCEGRRSFDELRKAPWLAALHGQLNHEQLRLLDRQAPERIQVPSGNRIRLVYEPGRPPVLAVRIQEVFGLRETPRIAGGRVRVLLHLLAPNMRPQQVTDDLESFWASTYESVRKELKRRYPKHSWPDDPLSAQATSRAKPAGQ